MKGIVLAGGRGTRLQPLTLSVNKHLLPVYDKPLIYWPVMTLVRIGIGEIMIVSNSEDIERYRTLFGDGSALGVSISYAAQAEADGIAGALAVGEKFAAGSGVVVILGDNVFLDATEIRSALREFTGAGSHGARVFLKEVRDPERFGVAEIVGDAVVSIEEKPKQPKSRLAATGLYFYDDNVFEIVRDVVPSARGELEITDVNNAYIRRGSMGFYSLTTAWIDAGTHESLLQANLAAAGIDHDPHKKIKILFGINRLGVGGAEHLVLNQIARINRERFEPSLVTLFPEGENTLTTKAVSTGVRWQAFSFRGFFDIGSLWKLYRFLRRERFDVIISNLFFTDIVLRIAAIAARVPVILTYEVNVTSTVSRRRLVVERILAWCTDTFIANSKEVLETTARRLSLAQNRIALNYSGIDLTSSSYSIEPRERQALRASHGLVDADIAIVAAGSLTEQKGHTYLIDAFDIVRKKNAGRSVQLIIFGEGELRGELQQQITRLGLARVAKLPGVAPVKEIVGIADIFIMPSLWEGMSVMLLEAMAAGTPIIATDVSGSRELITDAENGFLVPPKNARALAKRIVALLHDTALRARFGRASIKEVQKFSIENNLNTLATIINTVRRKKR